MDNLLNVRGLAKKLSVSTRTVHRHLTNKMFPFAIKVGGAWRFKEEDVEKWIEKNKIDKR